MRIKNIKSIQKTTKIMQMVSSLKMLQIKKKLINSRFYISKLRNIFFLLKSTINEESLLKIFNYDNNKSLMFIIASDRGLCGNFNSSIIRFSEKIMKTYITNKKKIDVIFIGKKASKIDKNSFTRNILKIANIKRITIKRVKSLIENINLFSYKKIEVIYNKFHNTLIQKPTLEIIKPLIENSSITDSCKVTSLIENFNNYEYEPANTEFILQSLIQNYIIAAIYHSLLESSTSENAARMISMKSANKSSNKILNKLQIIYNRLRQAEITTDLIEVTCGAESI